ncbi:hypothetical protein FXO37_08495 [Capsicum annuum]|nr:hypothetical protein FXO37_08495 [Capsicum annuum]
MMNSHTKKNKGFAFLQFATVEQAKRACTELKNPLVNGKECGVSPSQDNDTLFLGNICKTWTKEALEEKLKHYGVDNIEDLTLVEDTNNEGMNRGFAFVEFCSHSEAMYAFKRLQKRNVTFGVDRPAKVSFEDSFIHPGDEIMAQFELVRISNRRALAASKKTLIINWEVPSPLYSRSTPPLVKADAVTASAEHAAAAQRQQQPAGKP